MSLFRDRHAQVEFDWYSSWVGIDWTRLLFGVVVVLEEDHTSVVLGLGPVYFGVGARA